MWGAVCLQPQAAAEREFTVALGYCTSRGLGSTSLSSGNEASPVRSAGGCPIVNEAKHRTSHGRCHAEEVVSQPRSDTQATSMTLPWWQL